MTYLRYEASSLPGNVGAASDRGTRQTDGREGHLVYGPYFSASAGHYTAGFYIKRLGLPVHLDFELDVCCAGGQPLAKRSFCHADLFEDLATLVALDFELAEPAHLIEVRIHVPAQTGIELESLIVFSKQVRTWGGQ